MLLVIKSGVHDEKILGRRNENSHDINCNSFFLTFTPCFIINITIFIVLLHDQKLSTIVKIMKVVYSHL